MSGAESFAPRPAVDLDDDAQETDGAGYANAQDAAGSTTGNDPGAPMAPPANAQQQASYEADARPSAPPLRRMPLAVVGEARDTAPRQGTLSPDEFRALCRRYVDGGLVDFDTAKLKKDEFVEAVKKKGPAFCPVRFRDGAGRTDDAVEAIGAFVIDLDGVDHEVVEDVFVRLRGVFAFGWTTWGNGWRKAGECWRIVVPFGNDFVGPKESWTATWKLLTKELTGDANDGKTKNPSRLHFFARAPRRVPIGAADDVVMDNAIHWREQDGVLLDPRPYAERAAAAAAAATPKAKPASPVVNLYAPGFDADKHTDTRLRKWGEARLRGICGRLVGVGDGHKGPALFAAAQSAVRGVPHAYSLEDARRALLDVVDAWGSRVKDRAYAEQTVEDGFAKATHGPAYPQDRDDNGTGADVDGVDWQAFMADDANTDRDEGEDVEDEATRQWREDVARALADVRTHATKTTAAALVARGAIPFQSLAELEASDLPKTRWLVSGLVTERAVAVISGEPKTAKTWVAQEIAVAVATGGKVFGEFKTGEPKPAALFLVEDGASNTRARLRGILDGHAEVGAAARAAATKRLSVRCLDSLDLTDELHLARFVASVRRLPEPPAVVVLDPLRDLHTGAEDKSDDMAKVSAALRTLRNVLDAAVVFVHHAGKTTEASKTRRGGQRMRGSSALHGAVDAGLHMYEPQNAVDEATRTTTMRASIESEVKAGRSAGTFGMTLAIVDGEPASDDDRGECQRATFTFSRQRAAERAKDDAAERDEDAVLAALKARHDERPDDPEPFTKRTLIAAVGGQTARIGAAIERLTRAGGVSCVDGPNRSLLLTYSPAKAAAFLAKRNPDPFGGADLTEE